MIRNGGIAKIIETGEEEKELLKALGKVDHVMQEARRKFRAGEKLSRKDGKLN